MLSLSPSFSPVFLSWQHRHTENSVNSSMYYSNPCVPSLLCMRVCFSRCACHIDLLSQRQYSPLMSGHSLLGRALPLHRLFHFDISSEKLVQIMREASSCPEASNNGSCLEIEMKSFYVEWNYNMISSLVLGCGIILALALQGWMQHFAPHLQVLGSSSLGLNISFEKSGKVCEHFVPLQSYFQKPERLFFFIHLDDKIFHLFVSLKIFSIISQILNSLGLVQQFKQLGSNR